MRRCQARACRRTPARCRRRSALMVDLSGPFGARPRRLGDRGHVLELRVARGSRRACGRSGRLRDRRAGRGAPRAGAPRRSRAGTRAGRARSARRARSRARRPGPGRGCRRPVAHRWQVSRQTPTRFGRPSSSITRAMSSIVRPIVLPAPAEFSITSRVRDRFLPSPSATCIAGMTWWSAASRPRPRWLPRWKTTPSAAYACAVSIVFRSASTLSRVDGVVGRAEVDQVGGVARDGADAVLLAGGAELLGRVGVDVRMPPHRAGSA